MVTTLQDIQTHAAQPQGAQYRYDQLNRIKEMQVWQNMDVVNNQWQSSTSTGSATTALSDYRTTYRYDANGNILNLNRNGHNSVNLAMDSLSYHYIAGTNRLAYVDDAVASGNYSVDIDDQAVGNYAYDATGNLIKDVAEEIDSIVWTAYGKVLRVVRSSVSSKPDLHFAYGPDGNRLSKKAVYGNDSTIWTFYVRDAQGNTMATYKHKESSGVLHLTDHVMYGSSRLGSHERKHVELLGAGSSPITARAGIFGLERGDKRYELSNHLGNVLAVVSDRRAKASCADTLVSGYWADVISTNDYYPFGMGMVERGDDGGYRYGFNGMQRDDEWQGAGHAYDFGARMYDGRLGRWMSVDPKASNYFSLAPYVGFGNSPIDLIDNGGEWIDKPNSPGWKEIRNALRKTAAGRDSWRKMKRSKSRIALVLTDDVLVSANGMGFSFLDGVYIPTGPLVKPAGKDHSQAYFQSGTVIISKGILDLQNHSQSKTGATQTQRMVSELNDGGYTVRVVQRLQQNIDSDGNVIFDNRSVLAPSWYNTIGLAPPGGGGLRNWLGRPLRMPRRVPNKTMEEHINLTGTHEGTHSWHDAVILSTVNYNFLTGIAGHDANKYQSTNQVRFELEQKAYEVEGKGTNEILQRRKSSGNE